MKLFTIWRQKGGVHEYKLLWIDDDGVIAVCLDREVSWAGSENDFKKNFAFVRSK